MLEQLKKYKKEIFVGYAVIVPLVAIIMSAGIMWNTTLLMNQYNENLKALQYYDVRAEIEVEHMDFSKQIIPLTLLTSPDITWNNDSTVNSWSYSFLNSQLDLNATFRWVQVNIYVPEKAYGLFNGIACHWQVEDNEGTIRKDDFKYSETTLTYYIGSEDISRFMWKEDVPERIEVEVKLST